MMWAISGWKSVRRLSAYRQDTGHGLGAHRRLVLIAGLQVRRRQLTGNPTPGAMEVAPGVGF